MERERSVWISAPFLLFFVFYNYLFIGNANIIDALSGNVTLQVIDHLVLLHYCVIHAIYGITRLSYVFVNVLSTIWCTTCVTCVYTCV